MTDKDILIQKNKAIRSFAEKSTIPIIIDHTLHNGIRKGGTYGSGTLFKFEDKHFLITAAHVIEFIETIKEYIGIPIGNIITVLSNFVNCGFYYPKDINIRDKYDLGIIELSDDILSFFNSNYKFLSYENISLINNYNELFIAGFPFTYSRLFEQQNIITARIFSLMSKLHEPDKNDREYYDPKVHVLIDYSSEYYLDGLENQKEDSLFDLGGISGCSLWNYNDSINGEIWTPENSLKVVGIQSSVMKNKWIKSVNWLYVINAFEQIDINIYNKLKERLL